jgi:rhamnogalacturonyl hydrolase YesR
MDAELRVSILKLWAFCRANDWAGYDPYDALNSKIVRALPFLDWRVARLILTQALKRSPVNLRRLLFVPKTQNAKAIALFLSAFLKLSECGEIEAARFIPAMIHRLAVLRSPRVPYYCWGYSFPWQTRSLIVPRGAPNLVCTTFVASALLDAYEQGRDSACLDMAVSAAKYILSELYWSRDGAAGFCYPQPSVQVEVHNANLLAAALLCRVYRHTGEEKFLAPALRVARYAAAKQHRDGSWYYGEELAQRWIDNFHTGYNLCALRRISQNAKTTEFEDCIRKGFQFYRRHFFREDGAVRYFHNRTYPIDIHNVAQCIITLVEFQDLDPSNMSLARSVLRWAMDHMWDERGFFYYRVLRFCTIRTPYMRWSEAWMLLALSTLLRSAYATNRDTQKDISSIFVEA